MDLLVKALPILVAVFKAWRAAGERREDFEKELRAFLEKLDDALGRANREGDTSDLERLVGDELVRKP